MGYFVDKCGRLPTEYDTNAYVASWWRCVFETAEYDGLCSTNWDTWVPYIITLVQQEEPNVWWNSMEVIALDDHDKIYMGEELEKVYLGSYRYTCCSTYADSAACTSADCYWNVDHCTDLSEAPPELPEAGISWLPIAGIIGFLALGMILIKR